MDMRLSVVPPPFFGAAVSRSRHIHEEITGMDDDEIEMHLDKIIDQVRTVSVWNVLEWRSSHGLQLAQLYEAVNLCKRTCSMPVQVDDLRKQLFETTRLSIGQRLRLVTSSSQSCKRAKS